MRVKHVYLIVLVIFLVKIIPNISFAQIKQCNGPGGGSIVSLEFNGNNLFAATINSGIYISTDYGNNWVLRNTGIGSTKINCLFIYNSIIYAATDNGVYYSTDNGIIWINELFKKFENTRISSIAVFKDNIYLGVTGKVIVSNNGGKNWSERVLYPEDKDIKCLMVVNETVYAGGYERLFHSTDNGAFWSIFPSNPLYNYECFVTSVSQLGNTIYFSTDKNGIYKTTNNGDNWVTVNDGLPGLNISFVKNYYGKFFAGSIGYGVFLSTNAGLSWTSVNNGITNFEANCIAVNNNRVFTGTSGGVFYSTNYGTNWKEVNNGIFRHKINCVTASGNLIFACTSGGGIYCSKDSGESWELRNNGLNSMYVNCLTVSGYGIFAGTSKGVVYSSDKGISWKSVFDDVPYETYSILTIGDKMYIGNLFYITEYTYQSSDWFVQSKRWNLSKVRAIVQNSGNILVGSSYGVQSLKAGYHSDELGLPGKEINGLYAEGSLLLAGTANGVYKTTTFGYNWYQANKGLTDSIIYSIKKIDGYIFAGTGKGLFATTDYGENWYQVFHDGFQLPVLSFDLADSVMYIGTLGNSVFSCDFNNIKSNLAAFDVETTGDKAICAGETVVMAITGIFNGTLPYSFEWRLGDVTLLANDSVLIVAPVTTTGYTLIVKDSKGKTDTNSINITVHPIPNMPVVYDTIISKGGSAALAADKSPEYIHEWFDNLSGVIPFYTGDTLNIPAVSETVDYFIDKVNIETKCRSKRKKATVIVLPPSFFVLTTGDRRICRGDSVLIGIKAVYNGEYPYSYEWEPSLGLNSAMDSVVLTSPSETTIYTCIVTDNRSKEDTVKVTITVDPLPQEPVIGDAIINYGESAQLSIEGPFGCLFYWYDTIDTDSPFFIGNSLKTPELYQTKKYFIESEDNITKCRSTRKAIQVIIGTNELAVNSLGDVVVCFKEQAKIGVRSIVNGIYPFLYEWHPSEGLNSTTDSVVIAMPDATTAYTLIVTDKAGSKDTIVITVTVNPLPVPSANDTTAVEGDMAYLTATGPQGSTFRWYDSPAGGNNIYTGSKLAFIATKDSSFYLEAEDNVTGCKSSPRKHVRIAVEVLNPITFTQLGSTFGICPGDSAEIGLSEIGGGKDPYRFSWNPKDGLADTVGLRTKASPQATTEYTLTINDSRNTVTKAFFTLNVKNEPADAVIKAPDIIQNPKEVVANESRIVITLESGSIINHQCFKPDSLYLKIGMNRSMFYPAGNIIWRHEGSRLIMEQKIKLAQLQAGAMLMEFGGTILLGDTSETDISIDEVNWIGGVVETSVSDGSLTLAGLHEANGNKRLLDYDWTPVVKIIMPNPASDIIYIELVSEVSTKMDIKIVTSLGEIVAEKTEKLNQGTNIIAIETKGLATGAYNVLFNGLNRSGCKFMIINN